MRRRYDTLPAIPTPSTAGRNFVPVSLGFAEPGCPSLLMGALAPLLASRAFPPESAPADSLVRLAPLAMRNELMTSRTSVVVGNHRAPFAPCVARTLLAIPLLLLFGSRARADSSPAWHLDGSTDGVQVERRDVPGSHFDELRLSLVSTLPLDRLCEAIYPKTLGT